MKGAIGFSIGMVLLGCSLWQQSVAQDKATPQELVQKVQEAAASLSKSGESGVAAFNNKPSPWVWKDTYIFVLDCGKGVMAAHPVKPELIGKVLTSLTDANGKPALELLCAATKNANGTWAEYSIPKPGEKEPSRKISYAHRVEGTTYVVGAGIYDPQAQLSDLEKLTVK